MRSAVVLRVTVDRSENATDTLIKVYISRSITSSESNSDYRNPIS